MTLFELRKKMNGFYRLDEEVCVNELLKEATLPDNVLAGVKKQARQLVEDIREQRLKKSGLDAFLYEYDLSSEEGIALMCLAEAMLRIPDKQTADDLIRDKITSADWASNVGKSESFFVNASTWALMLTGKVISEPEKKNLGGVLKKLIRGTGEPVIRTAVGQAMKVLGKQFVMGRTIEEAIDRAKEYEGKGYRYSYDMLGEAARTQADADYYYQAYSAAIAEIGKAATHAKVEDNPGISVKLSALHPRYDFAKRDDVIDKLVPCLLSLAIQAKSANIGMTVDAEEARVLDLSLDVIERVYSDKALNGWEGFGLAVQSYQKRAPHLIDWLVALQKEHGRRIMIRLIKGAYWDSEIKYAQVSGLDGYPVFTRKNSTDVSYIACARKILAHPEAFYAQFGSHNAYTVAVILELTKGRDDFEFQCLHGMGHALYDRVVESTKLPCRIYAPVGGHKELLAYLVRRLLENGANTSFVNRIADHNLPIEEIIQDPVARIAALDAKRHPRIPLPSEIYGVSRKNSIGIDLSDRHNLTDLEIAMTEAEKLKLTAGPIIQGKQLAGDKQKVFSPVNQHIEVGIVENAKSEHVEKAMDVASAAAEAWDLFPVEERANCLRRAADMMEIRMPELMSIVAREAGKTLVDGVAEVREAVDFCRYYADQAEKVFKPDVMPGPTGEYNELSLHGRGVIVCISPWNFPLAIFVGQVVAALVAGNTVVAKPAEQTPLIAAVAVKILHEAGIPKAVLSLLPGTGEVVGQALVNDPRVAGVMFTGSTEVAKLINRALAEKSGPITPLVAETGGLNTMIVDSSALLEQVVLDVVSSAFGSAGQRCSALRVLYIQEDIADEFIDMLKGAMATIQVGNPERLPTDCGPVIDEEALSMLQNHFERMSKEAKFIYQVQPTKESKLGHYFMPCAFEIDNISQLEREVFGPFLHVIRYKASEFQHVMSDINNTGYGLTQGIHTRINDKAEAVAKKLRVGNLYVNRNTIGAVVGVQPFGGEGLSGTGPKAGGPHYLQRLATERTVSIDTTASGGNASLLTLEE